MMRPALHRISTFFISLTLAASAATLAVNSAYAAGIDPTGKYDLVTPPQPTSPEVIAVLREIQAENELALAYADYGRLHKQQGDFTPARAYLTQALEIFERLGTLGEPEKVRQTLAALPEGG